jgi:hypothetical protein
MSGCQSNNQFTMNERRGTRRDDQAAIPQSRESIDCTLDCIGLARVDWGDVHAK